MSGKLKSTLQQLYSQALHHVDIYVLFIVCPLLVLLELFHVIAAEWINTAILLTLLCLAIGTLRDRIADEDLRERLAQIGKSIRGEPGVRWYSRRSDSTPDMFSDLDQFKHVVFLGISHRTLPSYLVDKLQNSTGVLPWETVEVYFASDHIGRAYEGDDFRENIREVRHEIASIITNPEYVDLLPHLKEVRLFQHEGVLGHSGSMFGNSSKEFSVIYVVHSGVRLHGDTKLGITIRLENLLRSDAIHKARMKYYEEVYRSLSSARSLGVFRPSLWDKSAAQWSNFCSESTIQQRSMAGLVRFAEIKDGERILDLGSGSGETSEMLLNNEETSVVLLDGSPQMIRLARGRTNDASNLRVALCRLPSRERENIDLGPGRFSLIVIHQSLRDLADAFGTMHLLADWCYRHVEPAGRVVIAAHNGTVEMNRPVGFEAWNDPFRARLLRKLRSDSRYRRYLRQQSGKLKERDIKDAFEKQGFQMTKREDRLFEISFEERRQMWHVPAIIDSLVDIRKLKPNAIGKLVDDVADSLRGERTMPRTTVYLAFTAKVE